MVLEAIRAYRERQTQDQVIHLALVVPDIRLYNLLKTKAMLIQPPYQDLRVQLHILIDDKDDPLHDLDWRIRQALVETGLVTPADAHITYPDQVTLGWPEENK